MSRHSLQTLGRMLGLFLIVAAAPAMAATQPTLYTINSGTPKVLGQGVQKSWPIKISESNAFDAVFKGGMWLPNPAGGQIHVKYQRHILHDNGTWTWIGKVSTVHGDQSVVLTFGKDGVFGLIPQASGYPLRIVTRKGQTSVVETDSQAMARSAKALRLYSRSDSVTPPPRPKTATTVSSRSAVDTAVQAATSGPTTIDIMVAYTSGYLSSAGTQGEVMTRIQYLVDLTNQAYVDSKVNQQIRLVDTVEVNYPDNTSNQSALEDITGFDDKGNTVPIPASLQGIASLRVQYGADLVTLLRSFDLTTQDNCGTGWLIGSNQSKIVPQSDKIYGYNVVSDGSSYGSDGTQYYCLDTTFAHELGHNMGDAHDRNNATNPDGTPASGAYPYSYGYLGTGTTGGFSTIMAYGTSSDSYLAVFSNPDISICLNSPCGVADSDPQNSADNAHSMNNTATLIAQFEPTMVAFPPTSTIPARNDVNGDGYSDMFWGNVGSQRFAYWLLNGATVQQMAPSLPVASYSLVATGNFDGDSKNLVDLVWDNGVNIWLWQNTGAQFSSVLIGSHPAGWSIIGACDVDGDGKADLLWRSNDNRFAYWLMNGATVRMKSLSAAVSSSYRVVAIGDFNNDGKCDIVWDNGVNIWDWQSNGNGFDQFLVGSHPAGWTIIGAGDVDGDGKTDLLWRSNDNSRFTYWVMNGSKVITKASSSPVSTGYGFVGVGDFNGDGRADLLWKTSNAIVEWIGNGQSFSAVNLAAIPPGWVPAEP